MNTETFEDLAKKITYDRMLYFGYMPEQIAEAEAEDHSRCDWNADERNCLGEDEKSLHPIADELDATAESVVWVLEYVMRPVAEIRARLSEVEAERDAAKIRWGAAQPVLEAAAAYVKAERATEVAEDVRPAEEDRDLAYNVLAWSVDLYQSAASTSQIGSKEVDGG